MLVHGCTSDCFNCKQVVMYSVYCEKKPQVINWDTAGFNDTVCQCCPHIVQIFTQNLKCHRWCALTTDRWCTLTTDRWCARYLLDIYFLDSFICVLSAYQLQNIRMWLIIDILHFEQFL